MVAVCFCLNVDYDALHFHSAFSKYSFGREGVTKRVLCTFFIMLTNLDDPLWALKKTVGIMKAKLWKISSDTHQLNYTPKHHFIIQS